MAIALVGDLAAGLDNPLESPETPLGCEDAAAAAAVAIAGDVCDVKTRLSVAETRLNDLTGDGFIRGTVKDDGEIGALKARMDRVETKISEFMKFKDDANTIFDGLQSNLMMVNARLGGYMLDNDERLKKCEARHATHLLNSISRTDIRRR